MGDGPEGGAHDEAEVERRAFFGSGPWSILDVNRWSRWDREQGSRGQNTKGGESQRTEASCDGGG